MSKNIIPTIGHHVFKYDPPKYTEEGAPVFAANTKIKKGDGTEVERCQLYGRQRNLERNR